MKTSLSQFNVQLYSPNDTDATSFYRASGPFVNLGKSMGFRLTKGTVANWESLAPVDLMVVQRPFTSDHVRLVNLAQMNNKKIWVDYDDDLFSVPFSNKTFKVYNSKTNQNNIVEIICKADVVTVSTEALRQVFVGIMKSLQGAVMKAGMDPNPNKIVVVPNAYDERLFARYKMSPRKAAEASKIVMWRGSDTHDKDLDTYTMAILQAAHKGPTDWIYNFVGSPFWKTAEMLEQVVGAESKRLMIVPPMDPIEYFEFLWTVSPAIMQVPLWDCPFNRSKSNIGWIEATHCGAVALAPDWEEWRKPGVITYSNDKEYFEKLHGMMTGQFDLKRLHRASHEYIQENLRLDVVNKLRAEILEKLIG